MSFTLNLHDKAPDFDLKATDKKRYSLQDYDSFKGLVVFFTCNHCPYVIGSDEYIRLLFKKYFPKGIAFVGINSNSKNTYQEDSFECMIERMQKHKFPWIYLHDPDQKIARKYGALRTPHYFLFDESRKLIYTGRALNHPKRPDLATEFDLENALEEFSSNQPISKPLTNPIGCNVKWEGKDAHWMPPEACDLV